MDLQILEYLFDDDSI